MTAKITALVAARRNSKYLARFMFNYLARTADRENTELRVIFSVHDEWNLELVEHFEGTPGISFQTEDFGLGRAGLHVYFDTLLAADDPLPDWTIYFCEDHHIIVDGWDNVVREAIADNDPADLHALIPRWRNTGTVNHVLSRGYLETLGTIARHGNLDSYINAVLTKSRSHVTITGVPGEIFHDFTADDPPVLSDEHMSAVHHPGYEAPPVFESDPTMPALVEADAAKLRAR